MLSEFYGGVYSAELPSGQAFGKLSIKNEKLLLVEKSEGDVRSLRFSASLNLLKLEMGGAGDNMLFLETPNGMKFYCADSNFIKELKKMKIPLLRFQFKEIEKSKSKTRALVLIILFTMVLVSCIAWSGRKFILNLAINQIPLSWDKKIGELSFKQIEFKESFVKDASVLKTLDSIVAPFKLTSDINLKKHAWKVHLVEGPEVNAFAIPSGDIVIYSGLIFRARSVNEIQGVVAHEIAHVLLRHGIKNMGTQLGLMSIASLILGDLHGLIMIGEQGAQIASLSFSRDFEREADSTGFELLQNAGLNTNGLALFFESLQKMEEGDLQRALKKVSFLSTHPPTEDRIEFLNKLSLENVAPKDDNIVTIDFKEFQERLRNQIE
jgi:beta-barrel assembly-enhancing protease